MPADSDSPVRPRLCDLIGVFISCLVTLQRIHRHTVFLYCIDKELLFLVSFVFPSSSFVYFYRTLSYLANLIRIYFV